MREEVLPRASAAQWASFSVVRNSGEACLFLLPGNALPLPADAALLAGKRRHLLSEQEKIALSAC